MKASLIVAEQAGWATLLEGKREILLQACGRVGHRRRKNHIEKSRVVPWLGTHDGGAALVRAR